MTIAALSAVLSRADVSAYAWNRPVISQVNSFPALPRYVEYMRLQCTVSL